jgi:uncharacterized RDD family membrane protein YckC
LRPTDFAPIWNGEPGKDERVNDRKPPLIHLGSPNRDGSASADASAFLDDPRLHEGVIWRRCLAWLIDYSLCFVFSFILLLATCTASVATFGILSIPTALLAPAVIQVILACLQIAGRRAATLGMRATGLRVVNRLTGQRPDHFQSLLMASLFYASTLVFFPVLAVGFFSEHGRLLHDMMAGTLVTRDRPAE